MGAIPKFDSLFCENIVRYDLLKLVPRVTCDENEGRGRYSPSIDGMRFPYLRAPLTTDFLDTSKRRNSRRKPPNVNVTHRRLSVLAVQRAAPHPAVTETVISHDNELN